MSRPSDSRSPQGHKEIGKGVIGKSALALMFCFVAHRLGAEVQRNPFIEIVPPGSADVAPASSISREVKDVFARAARAVVKVHGADEHSEIAGTGFFIDPTGTLYTSYTVGGEADNFT